MSKKRKGMSADDKQRTVLSIYHEKLEPFNLKEIESLVPNTLLHDYSLAV